MTGVLRIAMIAAGVCLAGVAQPSAQATDAFDFTFTQSGAAILDNTVRSYQLSVGEAPIIVDSLEFEITGLSHTAPMDLTFLLLGPAGDGIVLMDEAGGTGDLSGVNLVFNDIGVALPHGSDILLGVGDTGEFLPDGPPADNFSQFSGRDATGLWTLVVIDDAAGDEGSFDSFTLRGHVVPEPATLSLLALGAFAVIRRKVRRA